MPPVIALAAGGRAVVLLTDKILRVVVGWMDGWMVGGAVQVRRLSEYLFRLKISAAWQRRCLCARGVALWACEVEHEITPASQVS